MEFESLPARNGNSSLLSAIIPNRYEYFTIARISIQDQDILLYVQVDSFNRNNLEEF